MHLSQHPSVFFNCGLLLDPPDVLKFKGPFNDYLTAILTIKNPTNKRIAFTIKITKPEHLIVTPNKGLLDHDQSIKVLVTLKPFICDPDAKFKLMVQNLFINDTKMLMITEEEILNKLKDFPEASFFDLKLKFLFEFTNHGLTQKTSVIQTTTQLMN